MDQRREFIQRVLPWPSAGEFGYCNLHYTRPGKKGIPGRAFTDPDALLDRAAWGAANPDYVREQYFCMSRQSAIGKVIENTVYAERSVPNATHLKAIWLDLDGYKDYPTKAAALDALAAFLKATGLPAPSAVVDSGHGYHVYWISARVLSVDEWRPYAEGLWALVQRHGLKADAITTDASRLLRIPGTYNYKRAPTKTVKLVRLEADYDFEKDLAILPPLAEVRTRTASRTKPKLDLSAFAGKKPPAALAHLRPESFNLGGDRPPLDPKPIIKGCPMYRTAFETGGKGVGEPEWHQQILGTTFCEGGRDFAHAISKEWTHGDLAYGELETDAKFDRMKESGIGWPSCKAFENAGCKHCMGCPLRGKITSPLNLAVTAAVTFVPAPTPAPNMHLPDDYTLDSDGYLWEKINVLDKDTGEWVSAPPIKLFDCKLSAPYATVDVYGKHMLCFRRTLDVGRSDVVGIPERSLATDVLLLIALSEVGVKACWPAEKRVRKFMKSWLAVLDASMKRSVAAPFGWVGDTSKVPTAFVFAGKSYNKDGTVTEVGWADPEMKAVYTPAGNIEPWMELMKIVSDQKRAELEVIALVSFASPLLQLAGQSAGLLSAWSETGAFKSSAVHLGTSVWGSAQSSKIPADISINALFGNLANKHNLPAYLDDATKEVMKGVRERARVMTAGQEPARMDRNRNLRPVRKWNMLCAVVANTGLGDDMVLHVTDTSAGFVRVFEYAVNDSAAVLEASTYTDTHVTHVQDQLVYNFGHMGMRYAALLGHQGARVKKLVMDANEAWEAKLKTRKPERFWRAMCACILVSAQLANECGATFNIDLLEPFLTEKFMEMRARLGTRTTMAGGGYDMVIDALTEFLKRMSQHSVWSETIPTGSGRKPMVHTYKSPEHQKETHVHWIPDDRVVYISLGKFEEYVKREELPYGLLKRGLTNHFRMHSQRGNIGACTSFAQGQETVMRIPVPPGSPLEDLMFSCVPADKRPADYVETLPAAMTVAETDLDLVRRMT